MSAIAGICHFTDEPINLEHGRRLMKELEKFPADDVQTWHSDKVFLGCHAQWITPESIGEKLPYYDHNRKLAITADAIIDNREELFEKLQVKKADQKTITDSELILLSYDKWGEDCPKYLVGDFAFMIWNAREQKMFGARDFSGARTLYYYKNEKSFSFCTVINPMILLPGVKKELNEQWLAEFLAIIAPVDTVDSSITPYKNIKQVPPSHSVTVEKGKEITLKQYCRLSSNKTIKLKSDNEYVEAFQEVYKMAVVDRLRTYRQVGAQLSGGLDSGSIAGFASPMLRNAQKILHTYSYIPANDFEDFTPRNLMPNETPFIETVVNHVGNINANYLDFYGRDSFSEIDGFLEIMEMPYKFFENSFWLKGMFEKAYEDNVGILLNGGRGNLSISWGSAIEFYSTLLKKIKLIRLVRELQQYSKNTEGSRLRLLPVIASEAFPQIDRVFRSHSSYKFPQVINPEFARRTGVFERLRKYGLDESGWFSSPNVFEHRRRHFEDVFHWNASNTLATKLSLKYSLWKRDPTNDLRVIKFCLSLPEDQYVQNGMDRALIRRATEQILPDKVRLNQRIRGVQGADWVHRMKPYWKDFKQELEEISENSKVLEFLDGHLIKVAKEKLTTEPKNMNAVDPNFKILMRTVILHRFVKRFA